MYDDEWLKTGQRLIHYTPASTKLKRGYTGFTLSVCPSVRLSICLSVDRVVSALYLQQYLLDPFHICISYQAILEGVLREMFVSKCKKLNFGAFFKFVTFVCKFVICNFVFFWLGIQYDSIVWVIMRWRGVSSECMRSSCSSCGLVTSYGNMELGQHLLR